MAERKPAKKRAGAIYTKRLLLARGLLRKYSKRRHRAVWIKNIYKRNAPLDIIIISSRALNHAGRKVSCRDDIGIREKILNYDICLAQVTGRYGRNWLQDIFKSKPDLSYDPGGTYGTLKELNDKVYYHPDMTGGRVARSAELIYADFISRLRGLYRDNDFQSVSFLSKKTLRFIYLMMLSGINPKTDYIPGQLIIDYNMLKYIPVMNNVNSKTVSDILSLDRLNRKKIMTMLDKAKRDLNSIRDMVKKLNK